MVGSTISGFGADTSDVDMCVVTRYISSIDPRIEGIIYLTELRNFIKSATDIFEEFHLISAKVPILRFRDSYHMLEVDLNFNNPVGVRNTHLLFSYSQSKFFIQDFIKQIFKILFLFSGLAFETTCAGRQIMGTTP